MTQEEKARAYDKAIEKIKYVMEHGVSPTFNKEDLQGIFPELKESEDEKNIKDLIDELKLSLRAANCQNDACGGGHEKRIALLEWAIAIQSSWQGGLLDIDGKIFENVVNECIEYGGDPSGYYEIKY